jgi:hypothetical protein
MSGGEYEHSPSPSPPAPDMPLNTATHYQPFHQHSASSPLPPANEPLPPLAPPPSEEPPPPSYNAAIAAIRAELPRNRPPAQMQSPMEHASIPAPPAVPPSGPSPAAPVAEAKSFRPSTMCKFTNEKDDMCKHGPECTFAHEEALLNCGKCNQLGIAYPHGHNKHNCPSDLDALLDEFKRRLPILLCTRDDCTYDGDHAQFAHDRASLCCRFCFVAAKPFPHGHAAPSCPHLKGKPHHDKPVLPRIGNSEFPTSMCKFYLRNACTNGKECGFAHEEQELSCFACIRDAVRLRVCGVCAHLPACLPTCMPACLPACLLSSCECGARSLTSLLSSFADPPATWPQ